ncbi:glycosyltransferase family 4 protein [Brachybacterium timonense]|uniref:glycosyltransferase family 4 protein n=1 Tax=Brachybacterium timonense TaxID=2050896 RepID=UPI000D0B1A0B|nr:glycosyltransferase family 4 protein [Brachybacterium timonense]
MVLSSSAGTPAAGEEGLALWCSPVADLGGVARHILDVLTAGVPGWRIMLVCPDGPLAQRARDLGAAVMTARVSPADGARCAVRELRRILQRLRPDLLHTHLAFADLVGVAAVAGLRSGQGQRIRFVSTEHGIAGAQGYYQSSRAAAVMKTGAHRARLHRTDAVIAVSDSTREQIRTQWGSGAPITVVRNGVVVPAEAERTPGLRVLSLSRLAPEKRIDRLIKAFARVAAEHPEARLTIAGTGPEEQTLRSLVAASGLQSMVEFPGYVEAASALASHDVLVQLSDWENLSYTLLDAVAHGLGVVATDVGGNAEILPSRCLVDGADPHAVATAITRQGLEISVRPDRAESRLGPVAEMCSGIAHVYSGVFR